MDYLNLSNQLKQLKTVLLLICISTSAQADVHKKTIDVIKSLLPTLNQKSTLKTGGCKFQKRLWLESLLTQKSFEEKIDFAKDCDLQGQYKVAPHKFFPLNYKIKNHKNFSSLKSQFKYGVVFEEKPTLKLNMIKAKLNGKDKITFKLNYEMIINPLEKNPIEKHKGGKLTIISINKKKLNKTYPIKFN